MGLSGIPLALADSMTTSNSVFLPGETMTLTYVADQASTQDVYLWFEFGDNVMFMDESGRFSSYVAGAATPARLKKPAAGKYKLLAFTQPDWFYTSMVAYLSTGKPGSDLLAPGNADPLALRAQALSFTEVPGKGVTAAINGGALYAAHCAACHQDDPGINNINKVKNGVNPKIIRTAIQQKKGGMGVLSPLMYSELIAIAAWISNPRFDCH
jgi:mono/diheme cytochrome c family protein